MKQASFHQLIEFMEYTRDLSCEMDIDCFRREILCSLDHYVPSDRSIFVLQNENTPFPDFYRRNVHEKKDHEYLEYYYSLDPFSNIKSFSSGLQIVHYLPQGKTVVSLEDIVKYSDFVSSEYYTDFLRPLNVHYELEIYLKKNSRVKGFIALLRSKRSQSFSEREIIISRVFSPFLSLALENIHLQEKNNLNRYILDIIDKYPDRGFLLFSLSGRLLYLNDPARDIFTNIKPVKHYSQIKTSDLPVDLIDNLTNYRKSLGFQEPFTPMVCNLVYGEKTYRMIYKLHQTRLKKNGGKIILILVDPVDNEQCRELEIAKSDFNLSKREVEVVKYICKGLKNSEIADKLYISDLTVKTHVQNIFEKAGINSRPALVYKIFTRT